MEEETLTFYKLSKLHKKHYYIDPDYVNNMKNITDFKKKRQIVAKWIFDVIIKFDFYLQTYFLAINYFDRYLDINRDTVSADLQKIATVCLFIAGKFEEIWAPDIGDFVWIASGAFTKKEAILQEDKILKDLEWYVNYVTPLSYINEFTKDMNEQIILNSQYLAVLTTFDAHFLKYEALDIASICIYIASKMVNDLPINDQEETRILKDLYSEPNSSLTIYFENKRKMKRYRVVLSKTSPIKMIEKRSPAPPKDIPRPNLPKPIIN
jgi:hypothetical protein